MTRRLLALAAAAALAGFASIEVHEDVPLNAVVDGDTVRAGGSSVRLLHINTPEVGEDWADEATAALEEMLAGGPLTIRAEGRDHYGRLLGEVFAPDGTLVNEELVRRGLAHVMLFPPVEEALATRYLAAEAEARLLGRGVWGGDPRYQGPLHVTSFHANPEGDDNADLNGEYLRIANISGWAIDLRGFRVVDEGRRNEFVFPSVRLLAGRNLTLHTGRGDDALDPAGQQALYWGLDHAVWNNGGDTATVVDDRGEVVDAVSWPRDREPASGTEAETEPAPATATPAPAPAGPKPGGGGLPRALFFGGIVAVIIAGWVMSAARRNL